MTIDGFQRKKSNIVILNTMMTNKLEFLKKKKQMNVICIKMKDSLIMIARIEFILNDCYKDWKKSKNMNTNLWVMNSKLFLIVYLEHLHFNNHDFFKKKADFHESSFESSTSQQIMSSDDVEESEQNDIANLIELNQIDEWLHQTVNESEQHEQTEETANEIQMIKKWNMSLIPDLNEPNKTDW